MARPNIAPAREMRLTMRVLGHWREAAGDRRYPRRADLNPARLGDDWQNCLLIAIDPVAEKSSFLYVGQNLRPQGVAYEGRRLGDCAEDTVLHRATTYLSRVLAKRVPISVGGAATHLGAPIVFRSVLLPMSETGDKVDAVFGAANFREIVLTEEIHAAGPPD
jgi:hypothetical protein